MPDQPLSEKGVIQMQTVWPKTVAGRYRGAETMVRKAAEIMASLNKYGTAQALRTLAGEIAAKQGRAGRVTILEEAITQARILEWVQGRWPHRTDPMSRALKLGEEAGEVQGAVIKMGEGRKTLDDLATETAQLVICAMALAESAGFDLREAIDAEWERSR